ncbi:peroxiredoxin family protein [Salinirubellus sp. GCM10025818]|uniref:peroxiredoxin family protein n=1 Tax=Salinirubellus TaxID=2162630 RepID=UPI0030D3F99C
MTEQVQDFSLPNVSVGPNPFTLSALSEDVSFVVLFFQRDYYCTNCRKQVQQLADRIEEFRKRNAEVVSIVPEPVERVEQWQETYDLPYALLADPNAEAGDAYDQPVRFGLLGRFSDFFGRMPEVVIIDRRSTEPKVVYVHRGSSTFDRPEIDEILDEIDEFSQT